MFKLDLKASSEEGIELNFAMEAKEIIQRLVNFLVKKLGLKLNFSQLTTVGDDVFNNRVIFKGPLTEMIRVSHVLMAGDEMNEEIKEKLLAYNEDEMNDYITEAFLITGNLEDVVKYVNETEGSKCRLSNVIDTTDDETRTLAFAGHDDIDCIGKSEEFGYTHELLVNSPFGDMEFDSEATFTISFTSHGSPLITPWIILSKIFPNVEIANYYNLNDIYGFNVYKEGTIIQEVNKENILEKFAEVEERSLCTDEFTAGFIYFCEDILGWNITEGSTAMCDNCGKIDFNIINFEGDSREICKYCNEPFKFESVDEIETGEF